MIEKEEFLESAVIKPDWLIRSYYHDYQLYPTIGMHSHNFYELNVIIKGSGTHKIGPNTFNIEAGAVFLIPPNVMHGYTFTNNNFSIFHILFKQMFFEKHEASLKNISGYNIMFELEPELRLQKNRTSNFLLYIDMAKEEELLNEFKYLAALEGSDSTNAHFRQEVLTLYIISLLCEKIEYYQDLKFAPNSQHYYIMKAVEYIRNNYAEKINLDSICDLVNMSRASFFRYFKACFGCSPLQYLHLYRINQAKKQLRDTNKSVAEIAQDCGFCDSSNFIHLFTEHEGITPSKYRRQSHR